MRKKLIDRVDYLIRKSDFPILMLLVVFIAMCFIYMFQLEYFNRQIVKIIQFFIFEKSKESLAKAGTYGDFIGGVLGTIIGIIGAIYVYKTFKYQQKVFRKERFESRYFEMIRLHKENVNDMLIEGYEPVKSAIENPIWQQILNPMNKHVEIVRKETRGKKIFVTSYYEFKSCYEICKYALTFCDFKNKERYLVKMAYKFLYWGIGINCPERIDYELDDKLDKALIAKALEDLKKAKINHFNSGGTKNEYSIKGSNITVKIHVKYKPFSGHASRFGIYYRHLFETVKFVVEQDGKLFDYKEVRRYLKMLRAQLSDHEQLMLYYNYLSGYGENWENDDNQYFSTYRMIHNIPIKLAKIGVDIEKEFKDQIMYIHDEGIMDGSNTEMFEQLEG